MEKLNSDLPKAYIKIRNGCLLELMEDFPPYLEQAIAVAKKKELRAELEIRTRIIPHNNRFFIYRVIANKKLTK